VHYSDKEVIVISTKELIANLLRNWIADIADGGADKPDEKIRKVLAIADENSIRLWLEQDIPDNVLRVLYGITDPINRAVLADMASVGKAKHWLESLGICHYRCRHRECDGDASTKADPNKRPCALCMKHRAIEIGLLRPIDKSGVD